MKCKKCGFETKSSNTAEAGCGRCGAIMVLLRRTTKTEKFECPNCGKRIVWRLKTDD